jgi:hypothetical protein
LRPRVALVGGLSKPDRRRRRVLRDTSALEVHVSETVLSGGMLLIGRLSKPDQRRRIVLRHALASVVHEPEIVVSDRTALFGKGTPKSHRGRVVAARYGVISILERLCGCKSSSADAEDERGNGYLEPAVIMPSLWTGLFPGSARD